MTAKHTQFALALLEATASYIALMLGKEKYKICDDWDSLGLGRKSV